MVRPLSQVVITHEEVAVPHLQHEGAVFSWRADVKNLYVIEAGPSIHAPVVAVSLLLLLAVDVGFYEDIKATLDSFKRLSFKDHYPIF